MKRAILTLVIMLGMLMFAQAQQPVQKFNPFSLQALEEVKADNQQKQKFKALKKDFLEKLKVINDNTSLSEAEKKKELQKLYQYRNKIYWREILTQEQAATLREKQKAATDTDS